MGTHYGLLSTAVFGFVASNRSTPPLEALKALMVVTTKGAALLEG
jgi:hypothetical protein